MPRPRRPRPALTHSEREEVAAALVAYVERTDDPHLAGFLSADPVARKHWVTKDDLYDWPEVRPGVDLAGVKQEAFLLSKGMTTGQSVPMSIFRLKQPWHGYRDRFEQDITTGGEKITFMNGVPRPGQGPKKPSGRQRKP